MSRELLETARRLASNRGQARQSDLKRAISTAYYALFHALAKECADRLVGTGERSDQAWRQTYRSLNHGDARSACATLNALGFPSGIKDVGHHFRSLQENRHRADYDPFHRVNRTDARTAIARAEDAIAKLKATDKKDRTAFAVLLLFKHRP